MKMLDDINYVRECFELRDGALYWRERPGHHFADPKTATSVNARAAGKPALGDNPLGYPRIMVRYKGKREVALVHRIVWALANGRRPTNQLDHINGDTGDYRLSNLREVTKAENSRNLKRPRHNSSGVMGVTYRPQFGTWRAVIQLGGRQRTKSFATFDEAVATRKQWEREMGFHPNHGRSA